MECSLKLSLAHAAVHLIPQHVHAIHAAHTCILARSHTHTRTHTCVGLNLRVSSSPRPRPPNGLLPHTKTSAGGFCGGGGAQQQHKQWHGQHAWGAAAHRLQGVTQRARLHVRLPSGLLGPVGMKGHMALHSRSTYTDLRRGTEGCIKGDIRSINRALEEHERSTSAALTEHHRRFLHGAHCSVP